MAFVRQLWRVLSYNNRYSRFHKAELELGLSWGYSVPSARLTLSEAMSVKLIHIQIKSVRLTLELLL